MKTTILFIAITCFILRVPAQVKIGDNPGTINSNSLLELESGSKGFLGPRVAINDLGNAAPLTAPVPEGMLVYSDGGSVTDGYYYWDGSKWVRILTSADKPTLTIKTANATLTKSETFVLASNDITITLPTVTAADNGLEITVKNIGTHRDLVLVQGNGGALVDEFSQSYLTRFKARTFVAYNSAWIVKNREPRLENIYDVSPNGSWRSIQEMVEFLEEHMFRPSVIRLCGGDYEITETILIDLPYSLTIQAVSYGTSNIFADATLAGKPMFRCISDTYFKMLDFTSETGYGTSPGEDAIRYVGAGTYNEIKDCVFDGFYNTILDSTNAELWIFECDFMNAANNAVRIHGNVAGAKVRLSETDFMSCHCGVNMSKASAAEVQLNAGVYDCALATDTAILYNSANFGFDKIIIQNNAWNNIGKFIYGFDFSRTDGRDANAELAYNVGMENKTPHMTLSVNNYNTAQTLTTAGTWYKCSWTNTSSYACKWKVEDNKMTYLTSNIRDAYVIITGNLSCNSSGRVISIGLVKNGNSSVRYGECDLRINASNTPTPFATVIYIEDLMQNDYYELYCKGSYSGITVTFQDVQWYTSTQ